MIFEVKPRLVNNNLRLILYLIKKMVKEIGEKESCLTCII